MELKNKIVHIAGSASGKTELNLINYGHELIRDLVNKLLNKGARFLIQVGKEDCKNIDGIEIPLTFDWNVMSEIYDFITANEIDCRSLSEKPIVTVVKQDFTKSIPQHRFTLWRNLLDKEAVQIEFLEEGWSSGAVRRIRMSEFGDILILFSGGEGVEHLAEEYNRHYKPIIPMDLKLGSSKDDGSGGASRLFSKMLGRSESFMSLENPENAGALLLSIKTNNGTTPIDSVSDGMIRLIHNVTPPIAFCVRLLEKKHTEYGDVDTYFRTIIYPLIRQKGFSIKAMGDQESTEAWINVEIFVSLHKAAIVIVDLTGLKPNCLMELGYALGRPTKVILTAMRGTKLPFDAKMYDCLFWDPMETKDIKKTNLIDYFERNINRPPIVRNKDAL